MTLPAWHRPFLGHARRARERLGLPPPGEDAREVPPLMIAALIGAAALLYTALTARGASRRRGAAGR